MINRLVLSGSVLKTPLRRISPNGVPHCQFYLEHQSVQIEAGLQRQAKCVIAVVISGKNEFAHSIKKGSKVQVFGFIHMHKKRSGIEQFVLHASEIKLID